MYVVWTCSDNDFGGYVSGIFQNEGDAKVFMGLVAKTSGKTCKIKELSCESYPVVYIEEENYSVWREPNGDVKDELSQLTDSKQFGVLFVFRSDWRGSEDGTDSMGSVEHYHFGLS